jgi:hypothetical protein
MTAIAILLVSILVCLVMFCQKVCFGRRWDARESASNDYANLTSSSPACSYTHTSEFLLRNVKVGQVCLGFRLLCADHNVSDFLRRNQARVGNVKVFFQTHSCFTTSCSWSHILMKPVA